MTRPGRATRGATRASSVRPASTPRLTRAQLKELERELRRERARMEATLSSANGATTPLLARQEVFRTLPDTDGGLPMMLEARTLTRHDTLVEALRRLEEGTYGQCLGCEEPIPYGRLVVMPETTYCIACGPRG
ncbi:MAG TPA: TraR/DksA C4-type zinc finger protein [Gemmatimonadaceae bacterium]|nr:TraR/DksA C4-type zinc finger protein [Gemmatimonadaceae bacterium]